MKNEDEWITGQIKISVEGHPLEMELTVPAKPVSARTMLPIFQQMSNSFVQLGVDSVENQGEEISCKMGCGACCRQAVPLSEAEAYQIAALVEDMAEPRRSEVKEKFQEAFDHFAGIGWFESLEKTASMSDEIRQQTLTDYFEEGIPCPFLENESCSIHENRPTVCREYLVTTPATQCESPGPSIRVVPLPVKPSATLCKITKSENLGSVVNFVPLILALKWVEQFPESKEKRTGEQWMAEFFKNLTKSEIPTNSKV